MINNCNVLGRLTADPNLRYSTNGNAVCQFTLAVNRPFTNQSGEREADFIDCVAFKKAGEVIAEKTSKGKRMAVHGRMQTRMYDDNNGVRRKVTELVVDNFEIIDWATDGKQSSEGDFDPDSINVPF